MGTLHDADRGYLVDVLQPIINAHDEIKATIRREKKRDDPDEDREDLETLATAITEEVEIRLEHEAHYDWVAFVPQRESDAGALTKYFGKVAGDDDFKIRGIEARQRSTPPFIEDVQRDCLERLDATRSPDAVLDCLQDAIKRLHAGTVPVEQLVERNRVSKPLEGYTQNTQNVAALKRARKQYLAIHPGQDIEYVVVDDFGDVVFGGVDRVVGTEFFDQV
jgi:DNA polymerase I